MLYVSNGIHIKRILRWWGQENQRVKKLDDLMPKNLTVTNSGKIALPEIIKKCYYLH